MKYTFLDFFFFKADLLNQEIVSIYLLFSSESLARTVLCIIV